MRFIKRSYFQGGGGANQPTPKEVKYKADKAIVVQPRFVEPFFRNYDYTEQPGVDGKAKHGPGSGWNSMRDFKSIKEFLAARRKKSKDKYKADDSWIEPTHANHKKRSVKNARHQDINAIDFPIDSQINRQDQMIYPNEQNYHNPFLTGPSGTDDLSTFPSDVGTTDQSSYINSTQIAGEHSYLPWPDQEGRSDEALNFGRDYTENIQVPNLSDQQLQWLVEKYLTPAEGYLFGLPDGISPISDLDPNENRQTEQPYTGTSDIGTQPYGDKWNV
jgi:hypothetical protein